MRRRVKLAIRAIGLTPKLFRHSTRSWLTTAAIASLISGCSSPQLPSCINGLEAPTARQRQLWDAAPQATSLELGVDGSSSMLGLTGSADSSRAWKALLKGVSLGAAANGLSLKTQRIGSGRSTAITSPMQAAEACFFQGCGAFQPVTSSLQSLWRNPGLSQGKPPLRLAISDLEVNNGDIANLVAAIKPHVEQGAVIGVLAVQLPFEGKVFNSQGTVIHQGKAERPTYLLATGPRSQVHALLKDVKTKAALAGVPTGSMRLTLLDEQANAPTLTAKSIAGENSGFGQPLRLGTTTFSPSGNGEYQFARLLQKDAERVVLSSGMGANTQTQLLPDLGLINVVPVPLPDTSPNSSGVKVNGFQVSGTDLSVALGIADNTIGGAVRANVPRGQLPEAWWLAWNRQQLEDDDVHNQTDGLLLLLTSLSKLMVENGTTPAASLCLAFSR